MNYKDHIDLFGTKVKLIPNITGNGAPTSATEGAVGCQYMDTNTGAMYKCIAAMDGVYTWETAQAVSESELTEMWLELSELREQRESVQSWPVMATGSTWRKNSGSNTATITEIRFEKEHTAVAGEQTFNPASSGSLTGYHKDNVITICTNGADKVRLNPNSAAMFAGLKNLRKISGLEFVDTSLVTVFAGAFDNCGIEEIDISNLHLERVTNAAGMFANCQNLKKVKFSKYGIPALKGIAGNEKSGVNGMFQNCTELLEVDMGRGLTEVGTKMFDKCLNLKIVKGLSSATTVGSRAFIYDSNLQFLDLNPEIITDIGESAFRLSCAEDCINMSKLPVDCVIGNMATRSARWGEQLNAIQSVALPTTMLDVPNADSQLKYTGVPFGYGNIPFDDVDDIVPLNVGDHGCSVFVLYHEWNCVYRNDATRVKANFMEFWEIFADAGYPDVNDENKIGSGGVMPLLRETLGWTPYSREPVVSAVQLSTIADRLNQGLPTTCSMQSANIDGSHSVLIVGSDSASGKLAVLDAKVIAEKAVISWIRFEDIFVDGSNDDSIWIHTY